MSRHTGIGLSGSGNLPIHGSYDLQNDLSDRLGFYGFFAAELKYVLTDRVWVALITR